jgi:hypothetical protein
MISIDTLVVPALTDLEVDEDIVISKKKVVIVVDDELVGMKYSHLEPACIAFLEDSTSPEFAELLDIARLVKGFSDIERAGTIKIREYFASDKLVTEVILSQHFQDNSTNTLRSPLADFLSQAERIKILRGHLENAFPEPQFELKFYEARPDIKELLACDLLVLDLVLAKSVSAVDEAVGYLKRLGAEADPKALPPIIIMSSHQELLDHKRKFSTESNISAAGLLVLSKAEVAAKGFAAQGLHLTYQQLSMQRNVAFRIRTFILSWSKALEDARDKAAKTLWNLDAAAMQQIHYTAFNDNDPYDEHLNELIAREYLWHVESNQTVGSAIDELDKCFREQFCGTPPTIQHRFIAPFVEPENSRVLLSHFTWAGWKIPAPFIGLAEGRAIREFNKLVPFGALLVGKDFRPDAECLVHITQQCDLNSVNRSPTNIQTTVFAIVLAIEVEPHKIPRHTTQDLVARSLQINSKEYDFKLLKGRMLATSIAEFLKYATATELQVCGRLRHDIATHFMQATVNHLTRPASQAMVRAGVIDAKLYLNGKKFKKYPSAFLDPATEREKIIQVTREHNIYNFQSDESIRIALWVCAELKEDNTTDSIDVNALCSALRVGCSNGQKLINAVDFRVLVGDLNAARQVVSSLGDPGDKINLVIVTEEQ